MSFADVFAQARPSIVSIRAGSASGSGFCVSAAGIVVTNAHVVGYERDLRVFVAGRGELAATVFAVDVARDLALVAIASPPPPLPLGRSADLKVGDRVLAVGDAVGLPATATEGIVSATARVLPGAGDFAFVQTDAASNPGISGGPLLDAAGRVVGVNTLGFRNAEGVAFAVPVDAVTAMLAPFAAGLPSPLPAPGYACPRCARPHEPRDRWCLGCGAPIGGRIDERIAGFGASSLAGALLEALGFDPGASRIGPTTWRLDAEGGEVWADLVPEMGSGTLLFSVRIGALPVVDPLPVLRFVTAANDRSVGPCRIVLDADGALVLETPELIRHADPAQTARTVGQLIAIGEELRAVLRDAFAVEPAPLRAISAATGSGASTSAGSPADRPG